MRPLYLSCHHSYPSFITILYCTIVMACVETVEATTGEHRMRQDRQDRQEL